MRSFWIVRHWMDSLCFVVGGQKSPFLYRHMQCTLQTKKSLLNICTTQVLHTRYQFMDHLSGMRRYLLLGQGDFIRHLMDLLAEDLEKPANLLYMHNLTGMSHSCFRSAFPLLVVGRHCGYRFIVISADETCHTQWRRTKDKEREGRGLLVLSSPSSSPSSAAPTPYREIHHFQFLVVE